MTYRNVLVLLLVSSWSSVLAAKGETSFEQDCAHLAARSGDDPARLHELFKMDWDHTMREDPEFATEVGYPGQNDRWQDQSLEAIERRKNELPAPLKVLASIDRSKLDAADQLNYDLFKKNLDNAIEGSRFKGQYAPINQIGGVHQEPARIMNEAPRKTLKGYEA